MVRRPVTAFTVASTIDEAGDALRLDDAALAAIIQHPQFETAMLKCAAATVELYRGHWLLNRLVNDRGRFVLGLMILDLHFVGSGGAGFTPARLREVASAQGVCSPGRIIALLASLRLVGFLQPVADTDRRLRRLVPTERFLDVHRQRWRRHFEALSLIDPAGESGLAKLHRPEFIGAFAHDMITAYRSGLRMVELVPELRLTAERDAGVTMLFSLLVADAAGQTVSIAASARRFSVSRAHVLTVFREAELAGLAVPAGPRGGYRAGPALLASMRRFFAILFLLHRHGIEAGRRAVATR
jgi:hypothetical protein